MNWGIREINFLQRTVHTVFVHLCSKFAVNIETCIFCMIFISIGQYSRTQNDDIKRNTDKNRENFT